jgi:arsenate reductase
MLKVYVYQGCSTCRDALKWLRTHEIPFTELPIRETPPSVKEILTMLHARNAAGENGVRFLLNTSGATYRELNLKEKLPTLSEAELAKLLAGNGNLIKRPFAIDEQAGIYLTGFKESEWSKKLRSK